MAHILVIANETVASQTLLDAVRAEAGGEDRITVIAPVNEPSQGYVVYEDTRRASAGRRLERTLKALREAGLAVQGFVVETGPVQAVKDALAQLEPKIDEIVVSTHARGALGLDAPGRRRRHRAGAGACPSSTSSSRRPMRREERACDRERDRRLDELLERIRERAAKSPRAS